MKLIAQILILFTIPYISHAATVSYDLYYPSAHQTNDSTTLYTGSISIEAPTLLDTEGGYNLFIINTENIDQNSGDAGSELFLPNFSFSMTTDDFLSGSLNYYNYYVQNDSSLIGGNLIVNNIGDLQNSSCIECDIILNFNTSNLNYQDLGGGNYFLDGTVAPNAIGPLLSYSNGSSEFEITRVNELYIAPVPVPGAIWLLGSGLLVLIKLSQRKT